MSVTDSKAFTLWCDRTGCRSKFGPATVPWAKLREQAARAGWTNVPDDRGHKYDSDYCPEHPPEGARP